jgi:hypothetical protein
MRPAGLMGLMPSARANSAVGCVNKTFAFVILNQANQI